MQEYLSRWNYVLILLISVGLLLRGIYLESAPPPFNIDEAHIAAVALCIADQGTDAHGNSWPLFGRALGGGDVGAPFFYLQAGWSTIFGPSVLSMRALIVLISLLTVAGVYALASLVGGRNCALWSVLAATLCPWSFQFARVNQDAVLVPFFIVWGLFFILRNPRSLLNVLLAALLFCLAMYTYASGRITAPLVAATTITYLLWQRKISWRYAFIFVAACLLLCVPMAWAIWHGQLIGRLRNVSIFSNRYFNRIGEEWNILALIRAYFGFMVLHLSPTFLILKGDPDFHHGSYYMGLFGMLDILTIVSLPFLVIRARFLRSSLQLTPRSPYFIIALGLAFLIGVTPAALTWDGVPNSLRSMLAWPILALITGIIIDNLIKHLPHLTPLVLTVASLHFGWYINDYFRSYPSRATTRFGTVLYTEALNLKETGNWEQVTPRWRNLAETGRNSGYYARTMRYYLMAYGGYSCQESGEFFKISGEQPGFPRR
jgi:4-amino-4-deoxy-L-arabinose transferase-like glycosyltransferase